MYKRILIYILIIIFIYLLYKKQENLESTQIPLSNEAIQNIASVYNNQDMRVTNMTATGIIKGNFIGDISSNIIKTIDISSNTIKTNDISSNTINTNNIIINNKKFRMFWYRVGGASGARLIKDISGNTYNANDWILNSGADIPCVAHWYLYINKEDNLWYLFMAGGCGWKFINILCMPIELFDTTFTVPWKKINGGPEYTADGSKSWDGKDETRER